MKTTFVAAEARPRRAMKTWRPAEMKITYFAASSPIIVQREREREEVPKDVQRGLISYSRRTVVQYPVSKNEMRHGGASQ